MWWILVIVVAAAAAWLFFRTNKPETAQPREKTLKELTAAPELEAPPATPSRGADAEPTQTDSITIGKNLPLPLTLSGMSPADAKRLAKGLESNDWSTRGWLTLLVARNNVRCEEIDAWVAGARPKLEMAIKKGIAASREWATASELDRADILEELTQEAVETLEVRTSDVDDARTLLKDEPADVTADDALLERFSGNTEAYIKLLSLLGSPERVWQSAAGQYDRKDLETLVEMGFVRRGTDIPIEDILPMLTLAQMQKVAGDAAPKKFTRKAAAIDMLKALPDLQQRLSATVSFRELFQLKPLDGLDVQGVTQCYEHAMVVADIIWKTLMAGKTAMDRVAEAKEFQPDGWELSAAECCPKCVQMDGKSWKRLPAKLPPFHIGCDCEIYPT